MKYLTHAYKITNIAFGILVAIYSAILSVRGLIGGHITAAIAMAACSTCGYFLFKIAIKEYRQFKRQNR